MASKAHAVHDKHRFNADLYEALLMENEEKVINLCRKVPDGGLHILTIHKDTVLHMATYSKQRHSVLKQLEALPENFRDKIIRTNNHKNTILHEAATSQEGREAAEIMLRKAPELLGMRNHRGETALYRAARYGQADMFKYLALKISQYDEEQQLDFLRRNDKTNILHISILAEHFGEFPWA
ncbi:hypothetical protein L1049_005498 [Liquidambar formosana]|uniref:Uncharacterized protein n=1 Tax=Liquidambar formosana TaxID=63359 RepID=A0AAP0N468_LIQFO